MPASPRFHQVAIYQWRCAAPRAVLINNAGLLLDEDGDVLEVDVQHFRDCLETNVYGPLRLAQAVMPGMISRGYGRVVNVSSSAGQISSMSDYAPPYSLSKAALNALTRLLASTGRGHDRLVRHVAEGRPLGSVLSRPEGDCVVVD